MKNIFFTCLILSLTLYSCSNELNNESSEISNSSEYQATIDSIDISADQIIIEEMNKNIKEYITKNNELINVLGSWTGKLNNKLLNISITNISGNVAHGYSIRFNKVVPPKNIDVIMLAPRFPGAVLRKNFIEDKGTLAYFDVYQDFTKCAQKRGLSLANAIGFTKGGSGILGVTLEEETEVDLFIEQFLIPSFLNTIQTGFDVLSDNEYTPEVTLMELYTSGEILGLLKEGIESGLYKAFQNNTSPTCQFGVEESFSRIITDNTKETAEIILKEIKSGDFSKRLDEDAKKGYSKLKEFNKKNNQNNLSKVQQKLSKIIK